MMASEPDGPIADGLSQDPGAVKPGRRNAGQSLVAEYRAARLRRRPSLQTELRNDRLSLRAQRVATLARNSSLPTTAILAADEKSPDGSPGALLKDCNGPGGPSVFAQFVDHAQEQTAVAESAVDEQLAMMEKAAPVGELKPQDPPHSKLPADDLQASVSPMVDDAASEQPALPVPSRGPALAAIGFGPGMVLRFRQLGIETASDLAAADEAGLRASLGDISRLVNVDVWIDSARRACADAV